MDTKELIKKVKNYRKGYTWDHLSNEVTDEIIKTLQDYEELMEENESLKAIMGEGE